MTATVHMLRPDMAPPETDFEREAVETLLSNIRNFREDSGLEPETMVFVTLGADTAHEKLAYRVGWFNEAQDGMRMRFAYASALLSRKATDE